MRLVPLALTVLAIALGACGGDDETTIAPPTTTAATTTGATGATGATGRAGAGLPSPASVDDVSTCLSDAGLDVTANGDALPGVEGSYDRLDVALGGLDQGALVVVFGSEEDAPAQAENVGIAGGVADVQATGNAVWGIDSAADETEEEAASIEGCMPSG
jgi:hypothetical protein